MNFQVTVLKILVSYPDGFALMADLKRDMAILATSGSDWAERTRRLGSLVPDLDIFSQALIERMNGGWRITQKGRAALEFMEARPSRPEPAKRGCHSGALVRVVRRYRDDRTGYEADVIGLRLSVNTIGKLVARKLSSADSSSDRRLRTYCRSCSVSLVFSSLRWRSMAFRCVRMRAKCLLSWPSSFQCSSIMLFACPIGLNLRSIQEVRPAPAKATESESARARQLVDTQFRAQPVSHAFRSHTA